MHTDKCFRSDGDWFCTSYCTHDFDEEIAEINEKKNDIFKLVKEWANHETQRRSFAFGNCNIENSNVTREVIDKAANEKLGPILTHLYNLAK